MRHLDAKTIRERLNTVAMALTTLEHCTEHPQNGRIAQSGQAALREIAAIVTEDEWEEHSCPPEAQPLPQRRRARARAGGNGH